MAVEDYTPVELITRSYYSDSVLLERAKSAVAGVRKLLRAWPPRSAEAQEELLQSSSRLIVGNLYAVFLRIVQSAMEEDIFDPDEKDPGRVLIISPFTFPSGYTATFLQIFEAAKANSNGLHPIWMKIKLLEVLISDLESVVKQQEEAAELARAEAKRAKAEAAKLRQQSKRKS